MEPEHQPKQSSKLPLIPPLHFSTCDLPFLSGTSSDTPPHQEFPVIPVANYISHRGELLARRLLPHRGQDPSTALFAQIEANVSVRFVLLTIFCRELLRVVSCHHRI